MKVVVIHSRKGGTGKTFLTKLLAFYAVLFLKKRCLVLDFDSQANLSSKLLPMRLDSLTGHRSPPLDYEEDPEGAVCSSSGIFLKQELFPYETDAIDSDLLHVLPADTTELEQLDNKDFDPEINNRIEIALHNWIVDNDIADAYDYIFIDTPPSNLSVVRSAFYAGTHLVTPIDLETNSFEGLSAVLGLFHKEANSRPADRPFKLAGIAVNKMNTRMWLHKNILQELEAQDGLCEYLLNAKLKQRAAYPNCDVPEALPNTPLLLAPKSDARIEAIAFCKEVFERINKDD